MDDQTAGALETPPRPADKTARMHADRWWTAARPARTAPGRPRL